MFAFQDAVRERVPLLIAIYGPTGSGKTYGGLLLAAGLAGPQGTVGMIDTENKRGSLYADDPGIRAALPNGYKRLDLTAPHSPARYTEALTAAEKAGITVCLIDSTTHEWSGEGGCCDIAETQKLGGMPNWAAAKLAHKRFMAHALSSPMHIIFCLRAHEKVKPVKKGDPIGPDTDERYEKSAVIPLGVLPDTEKNLTYEALLSFRVDDKTHLAHPVKLPRVVENLFPAPRVLTVQDGVRIREWNDSGASPDASLQLNTRARLAAEQGMAAYVTFYGSLTPTQKKIVHNSSHEENKRIATAADKLNAIQDGPPADLPNLEEWPDQPVAEWYKIKSIVYRLDSESGNWKPWIA